MKTLLYAAVPSRQIDEPRGQDILPPEGHFRNQSCGFRIDEAHQKRARFGAVEGGNGVDPFIPKLFCVVVARPTNLAEEANRVVAAASPEGQCDVAQLVGVEFQVC